MTTTDKEKIYLLEQKRFSCESFSDEYYNVLKELAVLYYKYGLYRDASNVLHFLDGQKDCPDWVNLHILAINIQLKEIAVNYFKFPKNHFFPRLEKISENSEKIEQRNNIFQEALHIFVNGYYRDIFKEIDLDAFYEQLLRFDLKNCLAWKNLVETVVLDETKRVLYLPSFSPETETGPEKAEEKEASSSENFSDTLENTQTDISSEKEEKRIEPKIPDKPEEASEKLFLPSVSKEKAPQKSKKILIVGYFKGKVKSEFLKKIKGEGYGENDFDFIPDDKASKFLGRIKPFETSYDAVIFGATPHSSSASGKYSSAIERFQREDGYPFTVAARTKNGQLKLTLSSLLDAFDEVCTHLGAMPA